MISSALLPSYARLDGPAGAFAKITVDRAPGSVTYRVTDTFKGFGSVTLLPNTNTRVIFESMDKESNAGEGGFDAIVQPATDAGDYTLGTTTLEIGEGLWSPVRRTASIGPFTCGPRDALNAANIVRTQATFTSEYRPSAPIYEAGSTYLSKALERGFITKDQYQRLRDKRGNITFRTVLGNTKIVDTITADPFRALAFADIPNQGVKVLQFVLRPGQKKSATVDIDVNCAFDTTFRSDGRRGQWFSLGAVARSRVYGKRPKGIPDFIWKYIRLKGDGYPSLIFTKQADARR